MPLKRPIGGLKYQVKIALQRPELRRREAGAVMAVNQAQSDGLVHHETTLLNQNEPSITQAMGNVSWAPQNRDTSVEIRHESGASGC